ncbi:DUF1090 family protein [Salmonella enterica]|nr:DUF1090 family protein [Salmonella enterica]
MRSSTTVSAVTHVWGIPPRQPSGKNIIRWLLKKRTNGSVRYCQYTSREQELAIAGETGDQKKIKQKQKKLAQAKEELAEAQEK